MSGTSGKLQTRVTSAIAGRRRRDELLGADLFADPAWALLLQLFRAELTGVDESVTSIQAGAGMPLSTALRWTERLIEVGHVERAPDPYDRRRHVISLSRPASDAMRKYFIDFAG